MKMFICIYLWAYVLFSNIPHESAYVLFVSLSPSSCLSLSFCACIRVCICIHTCVCLHVHVFVCVCVSVYVSVCVGWVGGEGWRGGGGRFRGVVAYLMYIHHEDTLVWFWLCFLSVSIRCVSICASAFPSLHLSVYKICVSVF